MTTLTPSMSRTLAALSAASGEFGATPFQTRIALAIWERAGAASSKQLTEDLLRPGEFVMDTLLDMHFDGLAEPKAGLWYLSVRGIGLAGSVFKHLANLKDTRRREQAA